MFLVYQDLEKLSGGRVVSDDTGSVRESFQNWQLLNLEYASPNVWQAKFSKSVPNLRANFVVVLSSSHRLVNVFLSVHPNTQSGTLLGTIDLEEVWSVKQVLSLANDIAKTQLETSAQLFKNP